VINKDGQNQADKIIKMPGIDGMVEAVSRIGEINREDCRHRVEEKFSIEKMVTDYEKCYEQILNSKN